MTYHHYLRPLQLLLDPLSAYRSLLLLPIQPKTLITSRSPALVVLLVSLGAHVLPTPHDIQEHQHIPLVLSSGLKQEDFPYGGGPGAVLVEREGGDGGREEEEGEGFLVGA